MRRVCTRVLVGAVVGLAGANSCSPAGDDDIRLVGVGAPIAVGAKHAVQVEDVCPARKENICTTDRIVSIAEAVVDRPEVFAVEPVGPGDKVTLRALAPGTAMLRVRAVDHRHWNKQTAGQVEAAAVTRVQLTPTCQSGGNVAPYTVPTNAEVPFSLSLLNGTRKLVGEGLVPIDPGPLSLVRGAAGTVVFLTPAGPQTFTLSSPVDATLSVPMQVYDVAAVDGLTLLTKRAPPHVAGTSITVDIEARVAGKRPCVALDHPKVLISNTPQICGFSADGSRQQGEAPGSSFVLYALAPGKCRVTAGLQNGTAAATLDLTIDPRPVADAGAPRDGAGDLRADAQDAGDGGAVDAGDAGTDPDAPPAPLTLTPSSIRFADTQAGAQTTPQQTVTVTNTGEQPTGPLAATMAGADADQFSITGSTCEQILEPGATCQILVRFRPTTAGEKAASLVVSASGGLVANGTLAGRGL